VCGIERENVCSSGREIVKREGVCVCLREREREAKCQFHHYFMSSFGADNFWRLYFLCTVDTNVVQKCSKRVKFGNSNRAFRGFGQAKCG